MSKRMRTIHVLLAALALASGCASLPRDAAAVLAGNTERLNTEIEAMTRARRQIEIARTRLIDSLERSSLAAQDASDRRRAVWRALEGSSPIDRMRSELFDAALRHARAAAARQAEIDRLDEKLALASVQARGERSALLTQSAASLGKLSRERSLQGELELLVANSHGVFKLIRDAGQNAASAVARVEARTEPGPAVRSGSSRN